MFEQCMIAVVVTGFNQFEVRKIPVPIPKNDEVLIKINAVGLCMTDIHIIKGTFQYASFPCTLGHEIAGEVAFVPEQLEGKTHLQPGERVVVETYVSCKTCEMCLNGYKNLCYNGGEIGYPPYQGGYAQYICVPYGNLYKMPVNMSNEEGAIFESFVGPVGALQRIGITTGDTVLIQGVGPGGLAFVQGARALGAKKIIVSSTNDSRIPLSKKYGADVCINPLNEDLKGVVMRNTDGKGVNVSIEASGAEAAIQNSVDLCKNNGKVILYGIPSDNHIAQFDVTQIILKQLKIYGSAGVPWAWQPTLDLYETGVFNVKDMISYTYSLEQFEKAIETLTDKSKHAIKVVLLP